MNREIKFRGYSSDMGEWHFGSFIDNCQSDFDCYIHDDDGHFKEVERETVSQYTGLKDKNGKEIYEGDIVTSEFIITKKKWPEYNGEIYLKSEPKFEVVFIDGGFKLKTLYNFDEYFHKSSIGLTEFTWFLQPLSDGRTHEYSDFEKEFGLRTHHTLINLEIIGNIYENPDLVGENNG